MVKQYALIFFVVFCFGASAYAVDFALYQRVIATIETGDDHSAIGSSGERSRFQFMERTWNQYTDKPFQKATSHPDLADEVFRKHFEWSKRALRTLDLEVSAYTLALLHNAGYGTIQRDSVLPRHRDYAQRASALYNSLKND